MEFAVVYEGYQINSFIPPDEYRELVTSLGYEVLELHDISSNTAQTIGAMVKEIPAHEEELWKHYGEEAVEQMKQAGTILDKAYREKMGYLLLVAEKPA